MKNKLLLFALIIFTPLLIFKFYYPAKEIQNPASPLPYTDKFLIGSMQTYDDLTNYDAAGFNTIHKYIDGETGQIPGNPTRHTPISSITGEHLFEDVPTTTIQNVIGNIYSNHNQSRFIWQRPKIEWMCFGQSSTYQAEPVDVGNDLWFYAFNDHLGDPETDNSQWGEGAPEVLFCDHGVYSQGTVLSRLKANTEQCRQTQPGNGNEWAQDTECDWIVKPRIRIPASFVIPANYETPVCKIIVLKQDGTSTKMETIIKAKYFLDQQGGYDGSYREDNYNFFGETDLTFTGDLVTDNTGPTWYTSARGTCETDLPNVNHADIQVWWYDNCDMWIDYVKVENDIADELFKGIRDPWITEEANAINVDPYVYNFYTELFEFNNIPCMAYVNQKISAITGGKVNYMADQLTFYQAHMPWYAKGEIDTPEKLKRMFFDVTGIKQIYLGDPYPLTANFPNGCYNYNGAQISVIPSTLPVTTGNTIFANTRNPENYDRWLQSRFDTVCAFYEGGNIDMNTNRPYPLEGVFMYLMKHGNAVSKLCNIPFIAMLQAHQWMSNFEVDREPTNEELSLMTNIAISYGAKGIIYWWMPSFYHNLCDYGYGFIDPTGQPRTTNVYGQPKWDTLKRITSRLEKWGPTLMSFDNRLTSSYIYRIEEERNALNNNTYFWGVMSYNHGSGTPSCYSLSGPTEPPAENMRIDCPDSTFLQAAVFKNTQDDQNKYFMIVNRRCSPLQANHNDGERFVRVAFDRNSTEFAGFNSWEISDITSHGSSVGSFDKSGYDSYVDLGWFNPGEGRIYRISPIIKSGGTLVADEVLSNQSFICKDTVFNDGRNITISGNTTISFTDTSKIVINGGSITIGDLESSNTVTLGSVTGNAWHGLELNNCEVRIYNTTFTGLANDTTYAINAIDCPVLDVRNCTFNINSNLKGGIKAVYYEESEIDNIYIGGNTFNFTGSTLEAVNISGYAGMTTPLIVENNTISEGNIAILLSGITGGAVKGNALYDNNIGISLLTSSVDVSGNTIYSESNDAIGIFTAGGVAKLNPSGELNLGGQNNITNTGTGTNNIKLENGYFLMDGGENIFNISDDQTSFHLSGYFPDAQGEFSTDASSNCFKLGGSQVDPPVNYITWGEQGTQTEFKFSPYLTGCDQGGEGNFMVMNLGNDIYDTIGTSGGEGGSHSSKVVIQTPKLMNDSLSIYIRRHDYANAKAKCLELLNAYPDSVLTLGAVSKLFLSATAGDTTQANVQELKNYYEGLILANGGNAELVKRANYYIQKCKVKLHEYSSALSGFQQIINQNPYNFEGLQARWDYMATSLLMQGAGGGVSSIENYELGITNENSLISDVGLGIADFDNDVGQRYAFDYADIDGNDNDKSPYTKEQKQDIRKSINNAFEITKSIDEHMIKKLEDNTKRGDIRSEKQLNQKKALQRVIKTEKPKNIVEHMKIVQQDIHKVLGSEVKSKSGKESNIPLVFSLSQNYPNPFNPVTTIKYALPNDVKVIVKIYDILGREVKTLVNDFQKAGYYDAKFDGSNYASGVYFYRIEAGEFVQSKKMVLIK